MHSIHFTLQLYGTEPLSEGGKQFAARYLIIVICTIPQTYTICTYHTFVTLTVKHWLEQDIAQWIQHEGLIQRPTVP